MKARHLTNEEQAAVVLYGHNQVYKTETHNGDLILNSLDVTRECQEIVNLTVDFTNGRKLSALEVFRVRRERIERELDDVENILVLRSGYPIEELCGNNSEIIQHQLFTRADA